MNVELDKLKELLHGILGLDLRYNGRVRRTMRDNFAEKWKNYREMTDELGSAFITGVRIQLMKFELFRNFNEIKSMLGEDLWEDTDYELVEAKRWLEDNK